MVWWFRKRFKKITNIEIDIKLKNVRVGDIGKGMDKDDGLRKFLQEVDQKSRQESKAF